MMKNLSELKERLIKGHKRDGRSIYDEAAKEELIQVCLKSGVSVARAAMQCGINANLLRTWITQYQNQHAVKMRASEPAPHERGNTVVVESGPCAMMEVVAAPVAPGSTLPALVPVVQATPAQPPISAPSSMTGLHVRLPNGAELDVGEAGLDAVTAIVQMLGRLPCSGSTKG